MKLNTSEESANCEQQTIHNANQRNDTHKTTNNTKVVVHNTRSLPIHLQEAAEHQAHVVALQETDVPEFNVVQTTRALEELSRNVLFGQNTYIAKDGSRRGRRVATFSSKPMRLVTMDISEQDSMSSCCESVAAG